MRSLKQQLDNALPLDSHMDTDSWCLRCHQHFLLHGAWPSGSSLNNIADAETWLLAHPHEQTLFDFLQRNLNRTSIWQRLLQQHTRSFLEWRAARSPSPLPIELGAVLAGLGGRPKFRAVVSLWLDAWWKDRGKGLYTERQKLELSLPTLLRDAAAAPDATMLGRVMQGVSELENPGHDKHGPPESSNGDRESREQSPLESGLLVQQAGIVILHPFLPRLFEALGLLDGSRFISDEARLQALFALHYLVTGRRGAEESELTLHKFLVRWPLDKTVPTEVQLSPDQYQESDHMLRIAISEWSALKNASIEGLRETFLQRSGSLQKLDEGYRLAVAGHSVDILLAQLPWPMTVVMLPWLTKPLFVYWGKP